MFPINCVGWNWWEIQLQMFKLCIEYIQGGELLWRTMIPGLWASSESAPESTHLLYWALFPVYQCWLQVPLSSLASDLITVLVLWFSQLQSLYLTLILFLQPICILFPILPSQRLIFWPWLLCWRQVKSIISHREAKLSSASVW